MKTTRKFLTLLLTAALAFSLALPAFATEPGGESDALTITITAKDTSSDHSYTAYQIFDGTVSNGVLTNVIWGADVNVDGTTTDDEGNSIGLYDAIKAITLSDGTKPFESITNTADSIADVLAGYEDNSDVVKAFAETIQAFLAENGGKTSDKVNEGEYTYTINVAETETQLANAVYEDAYAYGQGYYLILDSTTDNSNVSKAILNTVGPDGLEIFDKTEVPSVTKEADNIVASIDEPINYTLIGSLYDGWETDTADYTSYAYTFTDVMDTTLDLEYTASETQASSVIDGVTVTVYTGEDDTSGTVVTGSFTITYDTTDPNCHKLTVTGDLLHLTDAEGTEVALTDTDTIVVTYTATINKTAVSGVALSNTVTVTTVGTDENGDTTNTESPAVEEDVYTLNLDVTKVDGSDSTPLANAKFVLWSEAEITDENGNVTSQTWTIANVTEGKIVGWVDLTLSDGTYSYTDQSGATQTLTNATFADAIAAVNTEYPGTVLTSGTDGKFAVQGLGDGTYYLYETAAPAGYNELTEPVELVIVAETATDTTTGAEAVNKLTITVNKGSTTNGVTETLTVSATVENNKGATLPSTGGMGTTILYAIGAILVLGAGVLLIVRRRMRAE